MRTHSRGYYVGLGIMGVLYVFAGSIHFLDPQFYTPIVPPYFAHAAMWVAITGVAEILGGIGLMIPNGFVFPRTRAAAAWGIVALLICIWPVHINMCLHPEMFPTVPLWAIWVRMPLQIPLIVWAWWYTRG